VPGGRGGRAAGRLRLRGPRAGGDRLRARGPGRVPAGRAAPGPGAVPGAGDGRALPGARPHRAHRGVRPGRTPRGGVEPALPPRLPGPSAPAGPGPLPDRRDRPGRRDVPAVRRGRRGRGLRSRGARRGPLLPRAARRPECGPLDPAPGPLAPDRRPGGRLRHAPLRRRPSLPAGARERPGGRLGRVVRRRRLPEVRPDGELRRDDAPVDPARAPGGQRGLARRAGRRGPLRPGLAGEDVGPRGPGPAPPGGDRGRRARLPGLARRVAAAPGERHPRCRSRGPALLPQIPAGLSRGRARRPAQPQPGGAAGRRVRAAARTRLWPTAAWRAGRPPWRGRGLPEWAA